MIQEGNQLASFPVALPVTEFLNKMFCCLNRKEVFSAQKVAAKHKRAGQNSSIPTLDSPMIWQIYMYFMENFSVQQDWKLWPMKIMRLLWDRHKFWYQHFMFTLKIFCSKIKLQQMAPGVIGLLMQARFLPEFFHFQKKKKIDHCPVCWVGQAPRQPSKIAWH